MKVDLVIQGQYNDYTKEIVEHYKQLPWVGDIIISCWADDPEIGINQDTRVVRSWPLENNGIGNRNAQITTSFAGLNRARSEYCAKLRGDQKISLHSMEVMKDFMMDHPEKICVMGFYAAFPFHPRDHSFWGKTEKVREVFDIPLDPVVFQGAPEDRWPKNGFYSFAFRSECYIASQFLAKKEPRVKYMVENADTFIYDNAPRLAEAKELDKEIMPKYFVPFPRIDFEWPKHGLKNYHYDLAERLFGEYWTE
jgi:hypothetical protein